MKALAGTTWGHHMELLLQTYKSLIRSGFDYGSPIWFPNVSATNLKQLQVVQNKALRIATGCHLKSSIAFLHTEAKILPVRNHLEMLNAQFLASAMRVTHPSHRVVTLPPGPRKMKKTLYETSIPFVQQHLHNGVMKEISYKKAVKAIHLAAVAKSVCENGPNPLLGRYLYSNEPNASEQILPRALCCTIRQLRSEKSVCLKSYLHSIGRADDAICPLCRTSTHTTRHLFECPAYPTDLCIEDLWSHPPEVAAFLKTLPTFAHLPPVVLPPLPVPPEPPPLN